MNAPANLARFVRNVASAFDSRDEREFLPAALEVVETPPSPASRVFALVIVLFFLCAFAWALIGRVDVIATAPGRILPAGDIKIVQPFDTGVVSAIHVQDGQHVRAGQLLIELDPAQAAADRESTASDLMQAKLDVARLTALKDAVENGGRLSFIPPPDAPPERVEETKAAMYAQAAKQAAAISDLDQQISQKAAERDEIGAETDKINATMPMLTQKESIHRDLTARGYGTVLAYLDAQQELAGAKHDLAIQQQRKDEVVAARDALEQQRDGARSQYVADLLSDLRKAEQQESQLSQGLIKANFKSEQTALRSPIDGVVEQLSVHTLHGVVTPAEHLMIIVPDNRDIVVQAQLSDRDVGFVHPGQAVKVKIETYNFTRYGLVEGRVADVSKDVINPAEQEADIDLQPTPQNHVSNRPTYVARIVLSKTQMTVDGHLEPLQPGMTVTAEIKTGNRTILDYLLSPIARKTEESLHER
ncbi:MAG: HlyD family type I secretion periplasmic adaptor subunit [Caulobacteraceae bacterium]|nr:HlyD family type I secretion periplasmic adaptor subunit [Caulobacteraceae bacterium]